MMNKREIESLRDLAIAHFPQARESRAQAIQYNGRRFADSGLTQACMFENPEWTAIEKTARELLQLTFRHPDAREVMPFDWDGDTAEGAEHIAAEANMAAQLRSVLPQLEAAILDAAKLLCRLTGEALPPWLIAAPNDNAAVDQAQHVAPVAVANEGKQSRSEPDDAATGSSSRFGHLSSYFVPVPQDTIAQTFYYFRDKSKHEIEQQNLKKWGELFNRAARNGLDGARQGKLKGKYLYNPALVAECLINLPKGGLPVDFLARQLVSFNPDTKELILGST